MQRTISLLTIVSILFFFQTACKKYDEGPLISFRTVENRVQNTWKWSLALENGINRTGELADSTITFQENKVVKICAASESCREGTWNLTTKKQRLQLIFGDTATAYDLKFLSNKEMWLRIQGTDTQIEWELVVEE